MKRIISVLCALLCATAPLWAKDCIKVLAIGNSFSMDAIEQNLFEIAAADGRKMIIGNLYVPGCDIDTHLKNIAGDLPAYDYRKIEGDGVLRSYPKTRISEAIAQEDWDYISVQQASGKSGVYETYSGLQTLVDWVREQVPGAQVIFHQTWAYSPVSTHGDYPTYDCDQMKMYQAIMEASGRACNEAGISIIVPSGTAIQMARATALGPDLTRDGYHLDLYIGRYIAAATWYEVLTGKKVIGNSYIPKNVNKAQLKIAQKCVHKAVKKGRL
ncbi:MAG: DUF4886 domain-containing protein [Candidatus Cryptobacteroides sp.]